MHRDRPGAVPKRAFRADDLPMSITCWLALTDASPATSCMYALPAPFDEHYRSSVEAPAEMQRDDVDITMLAAEHHQHLRALPVPRGTLLAWSHRLLHWGSVHGGGGGARQTIAFGLTDAAFEAPLLCPPAPTLPPLDARLALVALTMLGYHHTEPVERRLLAPLVTALRRGAHHLADGALAWGGRFGTSVQRNLAAIKADAMGPSRGRAPAAPVSAAAPGSPVAGAPDDEDDEAHVEALLDAIDQIATYVDLERRLALLDALRPQAPPQPTHKAGGTSLPHAPPAAAARAPSGSGSATTPTPSAKPANRRTEPAAAPPAVSAATAAAPGGYAGQAGAPGMPGAAMLDEDVVFEEVD